MTGTYPRLPPGERICDLLDDPIGQMIMGRDGVTREEVIAVMNDMRVRLFGSGRSESEGVRKGVLLRLAA